MTIKAGHSSMSISLPIDLSKNCCISGKHFLLRTVFPSTQCKYGVINDLKFECEKMVLF